MLHIHTRMYALGESNVGLHAIVYSLYAPCAPLKLFVVGKIVLGHDS